MPEKMGPKTIYSILFGLLILVFNTTIVVANEDDYQSGLASLSAFLGLPQTPGVSVSNKQEELIDQAISSFQKSLNADPVGANLFLGSSFYLKALASDTQGEEYLQYLPKAIEHLQAGLDALNPADEYDSSLMVGMHRLMLSKSFFTIGKLPEAMDTIRETIYFGHDDIEMINMYQFLALQGISKGNDDNFLGLYEQGLALLSEDKFLESGEIAESLIMDNFFDDGYRLKGMINLYHGLYAFRSNEVSLSVKFMLESLDSFYEVTEDDVGTVVGIAVVFAASGQGEFSDEALLTHLNGGDSGIPMHLSIDHVFHMGTLLKIFSQEMEKSEMPKFSKDVLEKSEWLLGRARELQPLSEIYKAK